MPLVLNLAIYIYIYYICCVVRFIYIYEQLFLPIFSAGSTLSLCRQSGKNSAKIHERWEGCTRCAANIHGVVDRTISIGAAPVPIVCDPGFNCDISSACRKCSGVTRVVRTHTPWSQIYLIVHRSAAHMDKHAHSGGDVSAVGFDDRTPAC